MQPNDASCARAGAPACGSKATVSALHARTADFLIVSLSFLSFTFMKSGRETFNPSRTGEQCGAAVRTNLLTKCVAAATVFAGATSAVCGQPRGAAPSAAPPPKRMASATAPPANSPSIVPSVSPAAPREVLIGEDGIVRPAPAAAPEIVGKAAAEIPPSCLNPSPLAPEAIQALIVRVAGEEGADARLAVAVARQESGFDRNRVSSKGALGAMQLMPATAASYGITDPCDPEQNVRGGIKHLVKLTREFENPLLVLAAYNAGESRVYEHKGLPPFRETLTFVSRIANEYYGFTNAVIRPAKGGRSGTTVVDASATPPSPGRSREAVLEKSETPGGPKWIGGHVLNFD